MTNLESESYDKNDMPKKLHVSVRLHEAMQEKLKAAHHIHIQSKLLHWYLITTLEYTVQNILISLNTMFKLNMK